MPHDSVSILPRGGIEGVDNVSLYFGDGVGQKEVLRKLRLLPLQSVCGMRRIGVIGSNGKWTSEKDGSASVMHHDVTPKPDA